MQDRTPLDPSEQELEGALASLSPAAPAIAVDSLWYEARLTRERARGNRWRAAAAIAIVATGAALFWRPKPLKLTIDRPVIVREQPPQASPAAPPAPLAEADWPAVNAGASNAYLRLRDSLAQNGLESLPATAAGDGSDAVVPHAGPITSEAFERLVNSNVTLMRGG